MIVDVTDTEARLIRDGLNMKANFIETGNPILSAQDAAERQIPVKALSIEQLELVVTIRRLTERFL